MKPTPTAHTAAGPGLGRSTTMTVVVMGCTLLSRVLGFVRMAVITGIFGAGTQTDVINTAFSIPNNLRKLFAEGALSSAFVPVLTTALVKDPEGGRARRIVGNIVTFQFLILAPVIIGSIVFARPLIAHVLAEFDDPVTVSATAGLFRWLVSYVLLISVSAVFMGILNSHKRFFVPAFSPILFSVSMITAILIFHSRLGVYAVAVGVIGGGGAQLAFQYPLFHKLGYRLTPDIRFRNPDFRRIMRQWFPVLATSSVFAVTQQVAVRFASGLPEGSVTALTIAITFFQLPFGIFSASVTTVMFPRMSEQVARNDVDGLAESLQYGLRFLVVLLVPSTVFMCTANVELIVTAFQRGEFIREDALVAAPVLTAYSLGLLSVGAFTFMQRFFYSLNRYRITFVAALIVAVVDIVLSLWLKDTSLGTAGIAAANSIAFTVGIVILLVAAARTLGSIHGNAVAVTFAKAAAPSALAALPLWLILKSTSGVWLGGSTPAAFGLLTAGATVFSVIVLVSYVVLKVEMLDPLIRKVRKWLPGLT